MKKIKKLSVMIAASMVLGTMGSTVSFAADNTFQIDEVNWTEKDWASIAMTNDDTVDTGAVIREKADENGKAAGFLYRGAAVNIVEKGEEWSEVRSGKVTGYVKNEYLAFGDKARGLADHYGTQGVVTNWDDVNVFSDDDADSDVAATLDNGKKMSMVEDNGHWITVQQNEKTTGYVSEEDVTRVLLVDTAVPAEGEDEEDVPAAKKMSSVQVSFAKATAKAAARDAAKESGEKSAESKAEKSASAEEAAEPAEGAAAPAESAPAEETAAADYAVAEETVTEPEQPEDMSISAAEGETDSTDSSQENVEESSYTEDSSYTEETDYTEDSSYTEETDYTEESGYTEDFTLTEDPSSWNEGSDGSSESQDNNAEEPEGDSSNTLAVETVSSDPNVQAKYEAYIAAQNSAMDCTTEEDANTKAAAAIAAWNEYLTACEGGDSSSSSDTGSQDAGYDDAGSNDSSYDDGTSDGSSSESSYDDSTSDGSSSESSYDDNTSTDDNSSDSSASDSSSQTYSNVYGNYSDLDLLAAIIWCEAGNQSYDGMVAVGQVVMNRVNSSSFPNTVAEVLNQAGQFTPSSSGTLQSVLASGVNETCYKAAADAMNGASPVPGTPLYFNTHSGSYQLGAHYFS